MSDKPRKITISVDVSLPIHAGLRKAADERNRSLANLCRWVLIEWLKKEQEAYAVSSGE